MGNVEFLRFKKLLQNYKHFVTAPRMRLFGLLQHHPALTTQQLIKLVKKHDRATVYRNVDLFEKLGIITKVQIGRNVKIELSDMFQHHHHHMACVNCGKVYVLKDSEVIERQIAKISNASGFKPTDHSLEIRGICKNCQTKQ